MAKKFIDLDGLTIFKQQQDAVNSARFLSVADFLDADGKILNAKLPSEQQIETASNDDINALFTSE